MTIIQSIILGIVQGLTEFLPISSSAHLVLVPNLLGWSIPEAQIFPFDVLVQLGTLIAVIIYFWSDLWKIIKAFFQGLVQRKPFEEPNARLGWYLILASVPAMFSGLLLKDKVEAVFNDANATAWFLFGTAALLVLAEVLGKRSRTLIQMKWFDALWIGLFQAISIFPGISRSGSTIAGGMTRNMDRPSAARFSFLMSIPVMLGAGLISTLDVIEMPGLSEFLPVILTGVVVAMLVGYLSIHWLLNFLTKRSFYWFAAYCVLLAAVVLIVNGVRANPVTAETTPAVSPAAASTLSPFSTEGTLDQNPLTVAYSSSLEWLLPAMSTCADSITNYSIITHNLPTDQIDAAEDLIKLRWGPPSELDSYSAVLGSERLALIVNPANPLASLNLEMAQKIASAQFSSWGQVAEVCPECFATPPDETFSALAPALNFYPAEEEPQQLFIHTIMAGQPVAAAPALLIPGGKQMAETVAADPASFGFLPSHFMNDSVKEISVTGIDSNSLQMPILSISAAEPAGQTRDWLICLQKVLNP